MTQNKVAKTINKKALTKLPKGKCCASYCGDCTYFNPCKTSYGKCWCGYYNTYSHTASDLACSHYHS